MGRIADAKSPAQAKKIVIPAFVSKFWIEFSIELHSNRCEEQKIWTAGCAGRTCQLIYSHSYLDGMLHLGHLVQQ